MEIIGQYPFGYAAASIAARLQSSQNNASQNGAFGGSFTLDSSTIRKIADEATNFTTFPLPKSNDRAFAESINYLYGLIEDRLTGLSTEVINSTGIVTLIEQLLETTISNLDSNAGNIFLPLWAIPQVPKNATTLGWDFSVGTWNNDGLISKSDPASGSYIPQVPYSYSTCNSSYTETVLTASATDQSVPIKNITWNVSPTASSGCLINEAIGSDFAQISYTEPVLINGSLQTPTIISQSPNISTSDILSSLHFSVLPNTTPINAQVSITELPRWTTSTFTISNSWNGSSFSVTPGTTVIVSGDIQGTNGTSAELSVGYQNSSNVNVIGPTSVDLTSQLGGFSGNGTAVPFQFTIQVPSILGVSQGVFSIASSGGSWSLTNIIVINPVRISNFNIDINSVIVQDNSNNYLNIATDYISWPDGTLLISSGLVGTYTASFSEFYPCYSCSIDGILWSPPIMLDPERIYPDNTTNFYPLIVNSGVFPVTDSELIPTGITFTAVQIPGPWLFTVTAGSSSSGGEQAILHIDLAIPSQVSSISFNSAAARIQTISLVRYSSITGVWQSITPDQFILGPTTLQLPNPLVSSIEIVFTQPNYIIKQFKVEPTDELQLDAYYSLSSIFKVPIISSNTSQISISQGFEYDFGIRNLKITRLAVTGIAYQIIGPLSYYGIPQTIELLADSTGSPRFYLAWESFSNTGVVIDSSLSGSVEIYQNTPIIFPWTTVTGLSSVVTVNLYLKVILPTLSDTVKRFSFSLI